MNHWRSLEDIEAEIAELYEELDTARGSPPRRLTEAEVAMLPTAVRNYEIRATHDGRWLVTETVVKRWVSATQPQFEIEAPKILNPGDDRDFPEGE